ncbi:MAG: preprotein translocase subunit SecG [Planctomycetota bacterium]
MISLLLYLLFAASALLLMVVILVQEGRGGGLGDAFGGAGQQTFGVGARGITRFTAGVGVVFVATALLITLHAKTSGGSIAAEPTVESTSGAPTAPAGQAPPQGN